MQAIKIKNLKKHFGKVKAVDGVSFNVNEGGVFGFLGPNGAGKTTTIRIMMDFIRPTSGEVAVFGKDSRRRCVELKKIIGFMPSDNQLYDSWSGWDHLNFSQKLLGKAKILNDLLTKLNFNPKPKVKTLSSGNKKKLELILALMHQPRLLILDEPTNGLDPILQNTFYKLLNDFKKQGRTTFMSSHNLPEVESVCSKVGIIKDGKMVAIENISDLRQKRIYRINIKFQDEVNPKMFKDKNIKIIDSYDRSLTIQAKGDINRLLKNIVKQKVKDIQIEPASLENIFMEFYR